MRLTHLPISDRFSQGFFTLRDSFLRSRPRQAIIPSVFAIRTGDYLPQSFTVLGPERVALGYLEARIPLTRFLQRCLFTMVAMSFGRVVIYSRSEMTLCSPGTL